MKTKNIAAFPLKHSEDKFNPGMTLRDYFAGQIIVGLLTQGYTNEVVISSYELADALLIERQKYESQNNR
jgi:hypothetical protein